MATSGTVGRTSVPTSQVLEHAFRRVRIAPALQTPETVALALQNLYLILLNLSNRGLNLWCVQSDLVGLTAGQGAYVLPTGTIDVLNVVYCQPTQAVGTNSTTATSITTDLGAAQSVARVGFKLSASAASNTLTLAYSSDDVSYTTLDTYTKTDWATGTWYWFDLPATTTAQYFKLSGATTITTSEFYLATKTADLPVIQWNRDTWAVINFKTQQGRPSTNFYLERLLTPQLTLWPIPNNSYDHLQVFSQRQVQDIGTLTQDMEVPQRWVESIIWQLSLRLAFEIPSVDPSLIQVVTQMADRTLLEAERDEGDGAPIMLQPGIRVYTR